MGSGRGAHRRANCAWFPAAAGTGAAGEQWWVAAFEEATQHLNFSLAANATPWAVMVGGAVRRSQHQMHLRIDELATDVDLVQDLVQLAAAGQLSKNARRVRGAQRASRATAFLLPLPHVQRLAANTSCNEPQPLPVHPA